MIDKSFVNLWMELTTCNCVENPLKFSLDVRVKLPRKVGRSHLGLRYVETHTHFIFPGQVCLWSSSRVCFQGGRKLFYLSLLGQKPHWEDSWNVPEGRVVFLGSHSTQHLGAELQEALGRTRFKAMWLSQSSLLPWSVVTGKADRRWLEGPSAHSWCPTSSMRISASDRSSDSAHLASKSLWSAH